MYNLIVGSKFDGSHGACGTDRFPLSSGYTLADLEALPTLVLPEINRGGHNYGEQIARLGHVSGLTRVGDTMRFRFTPNGLPPIPVDMINGAGAALSLSEYTLWRSQWSLKQADLYQALAEQDLLASQHAKPSVFVLPTVRVEPHKVAVMMDFSASFAPVWEALQEVGADPANSWEIERADSIWENAKVMDDVALLLARSKVIVADLSGKNANVFYETGLAHMLGRSTVLITRSMDDVPFDLRSERVLTYLPNAEGLADLKVQLAKRLHKLLD